MGRATAYAAAALSLLWATGATAGECPPGERQETALSGAPDRPVGAAQGVAASVDLGPEIGLSGRALGMRQAILQPGARVPPHSHAGRPSIMYVMSGELTQHSTRCRVAVVHKAGDIVREAGDFSHWSENRGSAPAVVMIGEVVPIQK